MFNLYTVQCHIFLNHICIKNLYWATLHIIIIKYFTVKYVKHLLHKSHGG